MRGQWPWGYGSVLSIISRDVFRVNGWSMKILLALGRKDSNIGIKLKVVFKEEDAHDLK